MNKTLRRARKLQQRKKTLIDKISFVVITEKKDSHIYEDSQNELIIRYNICSITC